MITQPLHVFQYGIYKLLSNVRHSLLQIISLDLLEVAQGRASDSDFHLLCAEYFLCFSKRDGITFPNVSQPLSHSLDESQFFCSFLIFVEALHHSNPSASAGQEDWPMCIVHMANDFVRVHLQIGQRNNIL